VVEVGSHWPISCYGRSNSGSREALRAEHLGDLGVLAPRAPDHDEIAVADQILALVTAETAQQTPDLRLRHRPAVCCGVAVITIALGEHHCR
jgi:hypothetical protein